MIKQITSSTIKPIIGFTIVELSITIVIIGLIIAGVTAGKSLVKQAQLRSVISETQSFQQAINSFYLQYNALPGDMPNAFSFWGTNCAATASACNGSNNKIISWADIANNQEVLMAWKHLSLSGMILGNYSGTATNSGLDLIANVNVPGSNYKSGAWQINTNSFWSINVDSIIGVKTRLEIGGKYPSEHYYASLFLSQESYSIDVKLDDGIPYVGKIITTGGFTGGTSFNSSCTQGSGKTSSYQLNTTTQSCRMMFNILK